MGFFSRKTRAVVGSQIYQMSKSNPKAVSDSVLYAILSGKSIARSLLSDSLNGMASKVDRMMSYAQEHYTLGLPTESHSSIVILDDEALATIIATDVSADHGVLVDYNTISPLVPYYAVLPFLTEIRDWDMQNNIIQVYPPGVVFPPCPDPSKTTTCTVAVDNIVLNDSSNVAVISYTVTCSYIGTVRVPDPTGEVRSGFIYERAKITYSTVVVTEEYSIPSDFQFGSDYCIARYYLLDSEGVRSTTADWWLYRIDSDVYPGLNKQANIVDESDLLPVVPLRYNNQDMTRTEVQDTELYLTSKELLKKVKINIDDVATSLNDNAGVGDIDHAYIMYGIDLQTESNACISHLTEFFDYLADISTVNMLQNMADALTGVATIRDSYSFNKQAAAVSKGGVKASLLEYGLDMAITYSYIRSDIVVGNIGTEAGEDPAKIGAAKKEILRQAASEDNVKTTGFNGNTLSTWDNSTLKLKVQITDTTYKQVTVKGLVHANNVYPGASIITTLTEVFDNPDEHNLIIPVHYKIALKTKATERNALYADSLIIVMNSVELSVDPWYATLGFRFIIGAVSLVVTVGWSGPAWGTAINKAIEQGVQAVFMKVLESVIGAMVIGYAFDWIAEQIGPELMAIIGAVVAIAAVSMNLSGSMSFLGQSLPTSETLMSLSMSMLSSAKTEIGRLIDDISAQYTEFLVDAEAKTEKLEEAKKLLESPNLLSFSLLDAQTNRLQPHPCSGSPEEFYDLTIHTGNIGTLTLDAISTYFDVALLLPEADTVFS